ncbi:MAG TPA: hypothetical protein VGG50_11490 [Streptosporangiaceae bacterium]|jgi:hypothetical protein
MGLTADERKILDELMAKDKEPDASEEYEVEFYDTNKGVGGRMPYKQAKKFFYDNFGIGVPDTPESGEGGEEGGQGSGGAGQPRQPQGQPQGQPRGYFGRQTG